MLNFSFNTVAEEGDSANATAKKCAHPIKTIMTIAPTTKIPLFIILLLYITKNTCNKFYRGGLGGQSLPRVDSNHNSQIQNLKSYRLDDRANNYQRFSLIQRSVSNTACQRLCVSLATPSAVPETVVPNPVATPVATPPTTPLVVSQPLKQIMPKKMIGKNNFLLAT